MLAHARTVILCLVKLFPLLLAAVCAQAATYTIRNVNVVDVAGGTVRRGVNVVISGASIVSVSGKARGTAIDGKGKYLIPGLWDMNVHLWENRPLFGLYVANGVLGVRDMGSDPAQTRQWRAGAEAGRIVGPRIYTSGAPIDAPSPDTLKMPVVRVRNADEARRAVDTADTQGADFINIRSALSRDAYFSVAQRARVIRAVFAGPVPEDVTVGQAVDARQRSMEHMFGLALACSSQEPELREARAEAIRNNDLAALADVRQRTYETYSEARATGLFQKMARFDVWQTPTLLLRKRLALMGLEELVENPHCKEIPAAIRAGWADPRGDVTKATPEQIEHFRAEFQFHERLVASMQRHGVPLLAGTRTGDSYVLPGYALHDELELMVKAGLTPAEALRTATLQPARYFGIEAVAGTIARGRRADLVLLSGNPLDDIRNTRRVAGVILRGKPFNRKQLDLLLLKEK